MVWAKLQMLRLQNGETIFFIFLKGFNIFYRILLGFDPFFTVLKI